jgi:regulator of sirC expression with transglutaminase-like and TPR domain
MDPREQFVAAMHAPAAEIQLDVAALCIAAHAHPGIDVSEWCARLDDLAACCPSAEFDSLREFLFERERFTGNLDHYDDPENSFLDSVIERRLGIPITLSVLMIAIARRLRIDALGVGMPGHFLVLDGTRGDAWCDPFHGGALLDPSGCRRRFDLVYGGAMPFQPGFLAPTPPHAIVARMLANLEHGKLGADPVQRAWMCGLHLDIPGLTFDERMRLAEQLAQTGDVMRAATVFDQLAEEADSAAATRLTARARAFRAGMN